MRVYIHARIHARYLIRAFFKISLIRAVRVTLFFFANSVNFATRSASIDNRILNCLDFLIISITCLTLKSRQKLRERTFFRRALYIACYYLTSISVVDAFRIDSICAIRFCSKAARNSGAIAAAKSSS